MRSTLSERNIVVVLFVLVFITFSLAHEDSKKMEQFYLGANTTVSYSITPKMNTSHIAEPLTIKQ